MIVLKNLLFLSFLCTYLHAAFNATCPISRSVELMKQVYGCGSDGITSVPGIVCSCETISGDQMAICTGSLDYEADLYIVFSGSENIQDWIDNLEFVSVFNSEKGINMNVHDGFNKKFYQWKQRIDENVASSLYVLFTILFTYIFSSGKIVTLGHSLGGAVARISGVYLYGLGYNVSVVTAGEPAAFMKPFSGDLILMGKSSTRLVNIATYTGVCNSLTPNLYDPVPFLTLVVGYEHDSDPLINNLNDNEKSGSLGCLNPDKLVICKSRNSFDHSISSTPWLNLHFLSPSYTDYTDCSQCT